MLYTIELPCAVRSSQGIDISTVLVQVLVEADTAANATLQLSLVLSALCKGAEAMAPRRKKHTCVHPGCAVVLPGIISVEYCPAHLCAAFSASYGTCELGRDHMNKHINKDGEEWSQ